MNPILLHLWWHSEVQTNRTIVSRQIGEGAAVASKLRGSQNAISGCVCSFCSHHLVNSLTNSSNCWVHRGARQFRHLSSAPSVMRATCFRVPVSQNLDACFASHKEYISFFCWIVKCRESQSAASNWSALNFTSFGLRKKESNRVTDISSLFVIMITKKNCNLFPHSKVWVKISLVHSNAFSRADLTDDHRNNLAFRPMTVGTRSSPCRHVHSP